MDRHGECVRHYGVVQDVVVATDALHVPALAFEDLDELLARDGPGLTHTACEARSANVSQVGQASRVGAPPDMNPGGWVGVRRRRTEDAVLVACEMSLEAAHRLDPALALGFLAGE